MATIEIEELKQILTNHNRWTKHLAGGVRADLGHRDLENLKMPGFKLNEAKFAGAILRGCDSAKLIWTAQTCSAPISAARASSKPPSSAPTSVAPS